MIPVAARDAERLGAAPARRWVQRFNPIRIFFGPVFQRDVRIVGRRVSTYWTRFAFVMGLVGIFAMAAFTAIVQSHGDAGPGRVEGMQMVAPYITYWMLGVQFLLLCLCAPAIAAPAFIDERARRTLSSLASSPLSPLEIVGGKLASSLVPLLILAMAPLPVLLAIRLFGGLDPDVIVRSVAVTVCAVTALTAVAVWVSSFSTRASAATSLTLAIGALINGFPLIMALLAYLLGGRAGMILGGYWTAAPSPVYALISVMEGRSAGSGSGLWLTNCIVSLALAGVFLVLAALGLPATLRREATAVSTGVKRRRRRSGTRGELEQMGVDAARSARGGADALSGVAGLQDDLALAGANGLSTSSLAGGRGAGSAGRAGARRSEDVSRVVSDHPVLWREMRQEPQRRITRWVAIGIGLAFMLYMYARYGPGSQEVTAVLGMAVIVSILIMSVGAATGSITTEIESRTWSVLMTTPLSSWGILFAKALGSMRRMWLLPAVLGVHMVITAFFGGLHPIALLLVPISLLGVMFLLAASGVFMSLHSTRSSMASTKNLLFAVTLWGLGPLMVIWLVGLLRMASNRGLDDVATTLFGVTNAPAVLGHTFISSTQAAHSGRGWDAMLGHGVTGVVFTVVVNTAVTVALGFGFLALARSTFSRSFSRG
ncbi:hypothetical protein BH11PLA1_BH11PLA1_23750 [soil metagenome]